VKWTLEADLFAHFSVQMLSNTGVSPHLHQVNSMSTDGNSEAFLQHLCDFTDWFNISPESIIALEATSHKGSSYLFEKYTVSTFPQTTNLQVHNSGGINIHRDFRKEKASFTHY